nr:MAG TPA: hypothetical protein [Caudoviricetes sp.]
MRHASHRRILRHGARRGRWRSMLRTPNAADFTTATPTR